MILDHSVDLQWKARRLLENAIAFSSCVGGFEDEKIRLLREKRDRQETPHIPRCRGGSGGRSAESEVPGTESNRQGLKEPK